MVVGTACEPGVYTSGVHLALQLCNSTVVSRFMHISGRGLYMFMPLDVMLGWCAAGMLLVCTCSRAYLKVCLRTEAHMTPCGP